MKPIQKIYQKLSKLLLMIVCLLSFQTILHAQQECGTVMTEPEKEYFNALDLRRQASQNNARTEEVNYPQGTYNIPVQFHILKNGAGETAIKKDKIDEALNLALLRLNADFKNLYKGVYISFSQPNKPNYILDVKNYDNASKVLGFNIAPIHNLPNVVNIYIVHSFKDPELGGYATYPHIGTSYIFLNKGTFVDKEGNIIQTAYTISHEMGHFFGLYHTFENTTPLEYADGSNSDTKGDRIIDTPADPLLSLAIKNGCNYDGGTSYEDIFDCVFAVDENGIIRLKTKKSKDNFIKFPKFNYMGEDYYYFLDISGEKYKILIDGKGFLYALSDKDKYLVNFKNKVNKGVRLKDGKLVDPQGMDYKPHIDNIMAYIPNNCQSKFTVGQKQRMLDALFGYGDFIELNRKNVLYNLAIKDAQSNYSNVVSNRKIKLTYWLCNPSKFEIANLKISYSDFSETTTIVKIPANSSLKIEQTVLISPSANIGLQNITIKVKDENNQLFATNKDIALNAIENPYKDIGLVDGSHWSFDFIIDLYQKKIVSDYAGFDGYFQLLRNVSRGEFCKMAVVGAGIPLIYDPQNNPFSDLTADNPFLPYILTMYQLAYINGYKDGTFRPDAPISRAESSVVLMTAFYKKSTPPPFAGKIPFCDLYANNAALNAFILWSYTEGIFRGYCNQVCGEQVKFLPNNPLSRAESAVIISKLIQVLNGGGVADGVCGAAPNFLTGANITSSSTCGSGKLGAGENVTLTYADAASSVLSNGRVEQINYELVWSSSIGTLKTTGINSVVFTASIVEKDTVAVIGVYSPTTKQGLPNRQFIYISVKGNQPKEESSDNEEKFDIICDNTDCTLGTNYNIAGKILIDNQSLMLNGNLSLIDKNTAKICANLGDDKKIQAVYTFNRDADCFEIASNQSYITDKENKIIYYLGKTSLANICADNFTISNGILKGSFGFKKDKNGDNPDFKGTLTLQLTPTCTECIDFASKVVSYDKKKKKGGTEIEARRVDSSRTLGAPQENNDYNFVSLGFGGSIVLELASPVSDFNKSVKVGHPNFVQGQANSGGDLVVVETSFGRADQNCGIAQNEHYPERAEFWGSESLDKPFVKLQEGCRTTFVDVKNAIEAGHRFVKYLKIIDISSPALFENIDDGYDVDGIIVCPESVLSAITGVGRKAVLAGRTEEIKALFQANFFNQASNGEGNIGLQVYPNPVEDKAFIQLTIAGQKQVLVQVFDLTGKMIRHFMQSTQAGANQIEINFLDNARGLYLVRVSTEDGKWSKTVKVVKE